MPTIAFCTAQGHVSGSVWQIANFLFHCGNYSCGCGQFFLPWSEAADVAFTRSHVCGEYYIDMYIASTLLLIFCCATIMTESSGITDIFSGTWWTAEGGKETASSQDCWRAVLGVLNPSFVDWLYFQSFNIVFPFSFVSSYIIVAMHSRVLLVYCLTCVSAKL